VTPNAVECLPKKIPYGGAFIQQNG
jgi:hypothetical protein